MMFKVRDLGVTGLNGLNAGVASRQETALKFDFKSGRHWTDLCILINPSATEASEGLSSTGLVLRMVIEVSAHGRPRQCCGR